MNKLLIVARVLVMVTFINLLCFSEGNAHTSSRSEKAYKRTVPTFSDQDIIERLDNISSVIDINYTYEVGRRIREYTVNYRRAGERILGRVDLFFPLFEKELHLRNLPDELKYVAVVESNLEPTAMSHSGASGLWQFIKSTGKMKGLIINNYVDERRDPVKSTKAALEYLSDLYSQFDDWTLAIAAYNCGPGNVRKAIRRGGSKKYWEIRKFLPRETQKYVPRIIAAMYLMQYYHHHELTPELMDKEMKYTVAITDGQKHSLYKLSQKLDIPYYTIKRLNPQYKQNYVPSNSGNHAVVIPSSKYETYLKIYDQVSYNELMEQKRMKKIREMMAEKARTTKNKKVQPVFRVQTIQPQELDLAEPTEISKKVKLEV